MTRITAKLISALFVLGCGSGAMASPAHGQWLDSTEGSTPTQAAPPTQAPPAQGEDENVPPAAQSEGQGGYQAQQPSQNTDQDQDEDSVETQTWQGGQSHLGVMVMALTPELRRFFGVSSNRGVLIARVEPGSAAARAGIQVGDVLTRVGPQFVRSGDDVLQALAAHPGERLRIGVVRQGRMVHLSATVPGTRSRIEQNSM